MEAFAENGTDSTAKCSKSDKLYRATSEETQSRGEFLHNVMANFRCKLGGYAIQ